MRKSTQENEGRDRVVRTESRDRGEQAASSHGQSATVQRLHQMGGNQAVQAIADAGRLCGDGVPERAPGHEGERDGETAVDRGSGQAETGAVQSASPEAVAFSGVSGSGSPFPYANAIQQALGGHDLQGVTAHTGPSARAATRTLDARAFTMGEAVAFRDPMPSFETAVHEATHVLQQRQAGARTEGFSGSGGEHEQHAEQVVKQVSRGGSAGPTLDSMPAGPTPAVQRQQYSSSRMLTTSEYSASAEQSSTMYSRGNLEVGQTQMLNGAVRVDVQPIPDSDPKKLELTVTIDLSAATGREATYSASSGPNKNQQSGSGSTQSGGGSNQPGQESLGAGLSPAGMEGSMTGGLELSRGMKFTQVRVFGEQEAKSYLSHLRALASSGQSGSGQYPEFDVLAKLHALQAQGISGLAGVLGDATVAKSMQPGESYEMRMSGTAGASASAEGTRHKKDMTGSKSKYQGTTLGGQFSHEQTWERTVRVERVKDPDGDAPFVDVSVGFSRGSATSGGVSGGYGVASGSISGASQQSRGETYTFRLRTDSDEFDSLYSKILSASTPTQAESLANSDRLAEHLHTETRTRSETGSTSGTVGVGPVRATVTNENQRRSKTTFSQETGVTGTETGGQTDSLMVSAGNLSYGESRETTGEASVDESGGLTVRAETAETGSSIGPNKMPSTDSVLKALQGEHKQFVQSLLQQQQTWLHGHLVGPEDMQLVVGRAANDKRWRAAASRLSVLDPWIELRHRLLNPTPSESVKKRAPDPSKSETLTQAMLDRQLANHARAKAIADFFEATGSAGKQTFENMLQRWAVGGDLGLEYEWPPALKSRKSDFEALRDDVPAFIDAAKRAKGEMAPGDPIPDEIITRHGNLERRINDLRIAISNHDRFKSARAKADMLRTLTDLRSQVRNAYYDLVTKSQQSASSVMSGGTRATMLDDPKRKWDRRALEREIQNRRNLIEEFQATEKARIDRAYAEDTVESLKMGAFYDAWKAELDNLRSKYESLGLERDAIMQKLRPLTPDFERYGTAWKELLYAPTFGDSGKELRSKFYPYAD